MSRKDAEIDHASNIGLDFNRRTFGKLSLVSLGSVMVFGLRRYIENSKVERWISQERYIQDVEKAASFVHDPELAMHIDFAKSSDEAWERVYLLEAEGLHPKSIAIFCTLQQIEDPAEKEKFQKLISGVVQRGATPIISLGAGQEKLNGHPFAEYNEEKMFKWMKDWAVFLTSMETPMDIRFLYEMNVDWNGFVAYRFDERFLGFKQLHVDRFKHLFTTFRNMILELSPKDSPRQITVSLCSSSAGSPVDPYLPDPKTATDGVGVDGFGVDIFDFTEPVYNVVLGFQHMENEANSALTQMQEAQAKILALTQTVVPMKIYEIGSLLDDVEWVRKVAATFFAMGGQLIGYLDFDKRNTGRSTETDWRMSARLRTMFVQLYKDIADARKRRQIMIRIANFILGQKIS